jgi:hypothetical protein
MVFFRSVAAFVLAALLWPSQAPAPDRTVQGNSLTSAHDPAVRITVPKAAQYAGAERFVLYDVADCEIEVFVEADAAKNVTRLYWIQFEGYLPSKPDLHHTYDSPRHANLGGWDFYVDTWPRERDEPIKAGSDREVVERILKSKGYKMPAGMMYVRLVHLLDSEKQKELMIIYGEDLSATGATAASLKDGGANVSRWPSLENGLIDRAKQQIAVQPLPH